MQARLTFIFSAGHINPRDTDNLSQVHSPPWFLFGSSHCARISSPLWIRITIYCSGWDPLRFPIYLSAMQDVERHDWFPTDKCAIQDLKVNSFMIFEMSVWHLVVWVFEGQECMGLLLLTRYVKQRLRMRWEYRERFPCLRFQRKPLVSDPDLHHGTCVTHVPWRMSGSLTRGGGENVPGIPGACTTRNFTYLTRGPWGLVWYKQASRTGTRYYIPRYLRNVIKYTCPSSNTTFSTHVHIWPSKKLW